jgi:hypothetical protein
MRGPNDSAELEESFFIDLILAEQIGVISEITQEPIQLPEGSLGAVQPTGECSSSKRFRFNDDEPDRKERFQGMPAVGRGIDSNQKNTFERTIAILLSRMQTGNVSFHGFASTG